MNIAGEMEVLKDLEALSARAAELIADRIRGGTAPFRLALAGGSTPRGCYRRLAHLHQVPWDRVEIYLGDERFVPHDHPESNYRMVRELLLSGADVNPRGMFAVPGDGDAERSAQTYEEILRQQYGSSRLLPQQPLFDLQLLGLGEDGHTASLLPDQPVLEERTHWVAVVPDGRPEPRITLTYPALESSRLTVFLVAGAAKRGMLTRARSGDRTIPAGRLNPQGHVIWLADRAAAGIDAD